LVAAASFRISAALFMSLGAGFFPALLAFFTFGLFFAGLRLAAFGAAGEVGFFSAAVAVGWAGVSAVMNA